MPEQPKPGEIRMLVDKAADTITRLRRDRSALLDGLLVTTQALVVAESVLRRDSRYIAALIERRIPIDAIEQGLAALRLAAGEAKQPGVNCGRT